MCNNFPDNGVMKLIREQHHVYVSTTCVPHHMPHQNHKGMRYPGVVLGIGKCPAPGGEIKFFTAPSLGFKRITRGGRGTAGIDWCISRG